jgi:hypothetical protein
VLLIMTFLPAMGPAGTVASSAALALWQKLAVVASPLVLAGLWYKWLTSQVSTRRKQLRQRLERSTLAAQLASGDLQPPPGQARRWNWWRSPAFPGSIVAIPGNELAQIIVGVGQDLERYLDPSRRVTRPDTVCVIAAIACGGCSFVAMSLQWPLLAVYTLLLLTGGLLVPLTLTGMRSAIGLDVFVDYLADRMLD